MGKKNGSRVNLKKVPTKKQRLTETSSGVCSAIDEEAARILVNNINKAALALLESDSGSNVESDEESDEDIFIYPHNANIDEILTSVCAQQEKSCVKNYLENIVNCYTEEEFLEHFRVSSELFTNIVDMFEESDIYSTLRADKRLTAKTYVAVFLWFAGHEGCSFRDLANRFGLSISSISRIIDKVSEFFSLLRSKIIKWPSEQKKIETSKFFSKKGFPKAMGCIDVSYFVIDPPTNQKENYLNKKEQASLCMLGICDQNKKFLDVCLGHPGSCDVNVIFENSDIYDKLTTNSGDFYLLGDSAYPCFKNLITPYANNEHLTKAQNNFNVKLSQARVLIQHTFGILKQRFRQLYYCKLKGPQKLCRFIMACCVLHNMADENDFEFVYEAIEEEPTTYTFASDENLCENTIRDVILQQQVEM